MTKQIITRDRLNALCNINRWRGWTTRPYSVGEHTAIGAAVLRWFDRHEEQIKRWWMHDMHETEIVGDVPTPDKAAYMNTEYAVAVEEFDTRLGEGMGLGDLWWRNKAVKNFDRKMLIVENDLIASRKDPNLPKPDYNDPVCREIGMYIGKEVYANPVWVLHRYNSDAERFGWETV